MKKIYAELLKDSGNVAFNVPFDLNGLIRRIPGTRFHKKSKKWIMRPSRRGIVEIKERKHMFVFGNGVIEKFVDVLENSKVPKSIPFPVNFQFKTNPMSHQMDCLNKLWGIPTAAIVAETGTGKSKMSIDIMAARYINGQIKGVIIICPSAIKVNWMNDELKKHCPVDFEVMMVAGKTINGDRNLTKFCTETGDKLKILVIGTESFSQGKHKGRPWDFGVMFVHNNGPIMVIKDEGHLIKAHDSCRTINITDLSQYAKYKLIMTGTPIPQGPMDFYSIYEFLDPQILGFGDFYSFKNRYALMGGYEGKQIIGYDNIDELIRIINPWTFQVTKDEALDLPDKVYEKRFVQMAPELLKQYKQIKRKRTLTIPNNENVEIVCKNILTRDLTLQKIVAGYLSHKDGKEEIITQLIEWDKHPKIIEMLYIIDELCKEKQIIIWARFKFEISQIVQALSHHYGADSIAQFHGGNVDEREEERVKFKKGEKRFFVSNQATGGTGLTLNEASITIYYSNTFNLVHRLQSEDRNHRIGQSNKVTYFDLIMQNTIDQDIFTSIEMKTDFAEFVKEKIRDMGIKSYLSE